MHAFVSLGNELRSMAISPESGAKSLENELRTSLHVSPDPRGGILGAELGKLTLSPQLGAGGSPNLRDGQRPIDEFMWALAKRPGVPAEEGKIEELHDQA
jgi:hypothetical protein